MDERCCLRSLSASRAVIRILSVLAPLVVLGVIWLPEINHHYVSETEIASDRLEEGRREVPDAVLDEIRGYRLIPRKWKDSAELIGVADKMLQGVAELPGYEPVTLHLPLEAADLSKGSGLWGLQFAGLVVPEVLLDAYRQTGREEYYEKARDMILDFGYFERGALFDRGFLWNDHAVAARARTLGDFWAAYRHRRDYDPRIAAAVWRFAERTEEMLSKPDNYTFATNHGVMQNLALWHLCIAFPTMKNCEADKQLALRRLTEEFDFYVAPDGVILEHSAGYHEFGTFLLGLALRYSTLLNIEVPREWAKKYELAKVFYAEIRRPDGTLPTFGDTEDQTDPQGIPIALEQANGKFSALEPAKEWRPESAFQVYPLSGYVLYWEGMENWPATNDLAQAVLVASYFRGHGHKHADELSALFWAGGQNWWTNAGYWSYDDPNRTFAEGWNGSNAPHLAGESPGSDRKASVVGFAHSKEVVAAEAERRGPGNFVARRLMLRFRQDIWIVADSYSGSAGSSVRTFWTTAPGMSVETVGDGSEFVLRSKTGTALRASFLGVPKLQLSRYRGSRTPFAGWVMHQESPQPVEALLAEQPSGQGCAFTVWSLQRQHLSRSIENGPIASNVECKGETSWSIRVNSEAGVETVERRGDEIAYSGGVTRAKVVRVTLETVSRQVERETSIVEEAYGKAAAHYPRFRDLMEYRRRASVAVIILLVSQELALIAVRRRWNSVVSGVQMLAVLSWAATGVWLHWSYLAAH